MYMKDETYKTSICKIAKRLYPTQEIDKEAIQFIYCLTSDVFEKIASKSAGIIRHTEHKVLSSHCVYKATILVLPKKLHQHVICNGRAVVRQYITSSLAATTKKMDLQFSYLRTINYLETGHYGFKHVNKLAGVCLAAILESFVKRLLSCVGRFTPIIKNYQIANILQNEQLEFKELFCPALPRTIYLPRIEGVNLPTKRIHSAPKQE